MSASRPRLDLGRASRRGSPSRAPAGERPTPTRRRPLGGNQVEQEPQVAPHRRHGHHGQAPAGEGVVGVVPLGTLGVEPDAAVRHQVGELRQQRDQQLLAQRDQPDLALPRRATSFPSAPKSRARPSSARLSALSKTIDSRGSSRSSAEPGDPVRDPRVGIPQLAELRPPGPRAARLPALEEPVEVDDLVVAPVPDVAPRVALVRDLPVAAVAGDPVGVVAVGGAGIQEDGDELAEVPGVALGRAPPSSGRCPASCPRSRRAAARDRPSGWMLKRFQGRLGSPWRRLKVSGRYVRSSRARLRIIPLRGRAAQLVRRIEAGSLGQPLGVALVDAAVLASQVLADIRDGAHRRCRRMSRRASRCRGRWRRGAAVAASSAVLLERIAASDAPQDPCPALADGGPEVDGDARPVSSKRSRRSMSAAWSRPVSRRSTHA